MTIPPGIGKIPPGIYFVQARDKVKKSLAKHEFCHWRQADKMGGPVFLAAMALQYRFYGYKKAPLEVEARAAEKTPLTAQEAAWWGA